MQSNAIRVLVVDDRPSVRTGLSVFFDLSDDLAMIGEASNGVEAIALCARLQPDLVLMDMKMPIMDGITATRLIRQRFPHIPVLMLTSSSNSDKLQAALDAGACGYIYKHNALGQLAKAIYKAARSQAVSAR